MGEETKKPEEEVKGEKQQTEGEKPADAVPEIVLKVYMHCEGCARKVRRCLKGFQGVEDVVTDCRSHTVVVRGHGADPLKVLERVQRKSHRHVELLSPLPQPPVEDPGKADDGKPESEEKSESPPPPPEITVVLKVHMHCEGCASEMKKRIYRMKGVEWVKVDLKSSQVTVRGIMDAASLVSYVHRRTGKHAEIVNQDPEKEEKPAGEESKETAAEGDGKADGGEDEAVKKAAEGDAPQGPAPSPQLMEIKKSDYFYYLPPMYTAEMAAYPPQLFSDENPNSCAVM